MSGDPLVRIPNATVYQVERASNAVRDIGNGDFVIAYASSGDDAGLVAQVGAVSWPLGRWAASLRFDDYTYSFQLPHSPPDEAAASCYYCLTLQPDTPLELIDLLQAVLASGSAYHDRQHVAVQPPPPAAAAAAAAGAEGVRGAPHRQQQASPAGPSNADRIAAGLQRGGQLAAAGVLAAAAWAGVAIHRGADAAVARMQPAAAAAAAASPGGQAASGPGRPRAQISPEAQARLERATHAAAKAAEVSGRAVAGALSVTAYVAGALVQRVAATDLGRRVATGSRTQDLRKVGAAGVEAVEAVYESLADAARVVLAHTHTAATRVAGHRYGPAAAQATGAGFQVTRGVVETGLNVYKLRPTALAKRVLRGSARGVVLGQGAAAGRTQSAPPTAGPVPQPPQQAAAGGAATAPEAASAAGGASSSWSVPQPSAATAPAVAPAAAPAFGPTGGVAAAAAAMLVSLTAPPPPHARPFDGPGAAGTSGPAAVSAAGAADGVVDGLVVSGPVPAQPVLVADYTPSAAAAAAAAAGGGGPGGALQGAWVPGPAGLPYPAVSSGQYAARYYPAVPRT